MSDLISRQAAIDAIKALWDGAPTAQHVSAMFDCEDVIQALPSVHPEQQSLSDWKEDFKGYINAIAIDLSRDDYYAIMEYIDEVPSAQPDLDEWCTDCKEYDSERHCCPRYNRVIREAVEEVRHPEIIHCQDCKHYYFADNRIPQEQRYTCDLDGDRWTPDSYCSFAERREK